MGGSALRLAAAGLLFTVSTPSLADPPLRLDRELVPRAGIVPPRADRAPLALRASGALSRLPRSAPPTAPGAPGPSVPQPLIVMLHVNAAPRGERYARIAENGELFVKVEDLRDILRIPPDARIVTIEGEAYVALAGFPGSELAFDEKTLTLDVRFPPELFPAQRIDLTVRDLPVEVYGKPTSALVGYRVDYLGSGHGDGGTISFSEDSAFAWRGWLLRSRSFHSRSDGETRSTRMETQVVRDDRDDLRRLTLGDFFTPGLPQGSAVPMAGISFAKSYPLAPGTPRTPSVGFQGLAQTPSQVEFYVGNTMVLRQDVAPGPFQIQNFSYYGGRRDVRVVIRDALGRQQTIAYPFYFTDQGLAAGLHDYAYQAGWLREGFGDRSNEYGRPAISAFHHYGFSDAWTLGLRAEADTRIANAGASAFYRNERLGSFALHAGASRERESGETGGALSLSHTYIAGEFSTHWIWQRYSDRYRFLYTGPAPRLPARDLSASVSYGGLALGSLNLNYTRLALHGEPERRSVSLNYSKPLGRRLSLYATLRRELAPDSGADFFVGLQYRPSDRQNLSVSHEDSDARGRTSAFHWGTEVPRGEGVDLAVDAERHELGGVTREVIAPRARWHARHATLGAQAMHLRSPGGADTTTYSLALDGSVAAAGGQWALSRGIADSFALVQVAPPVAGIRVYENAQLVGRTDERGRILLTDVSSYATNSVAIEDKDVPIEYAIERVRTTFSPPFRTGTLLPFRLERVRSFVGAFRHRMQGSLAPVAFRMVVIEAAGRRFEVPTGEKGEFYFENVPSGRQRASFEIDGRTCEFTIDLPPGEDMMVELGNVMTCDAPR